MSCLYFHCSVCDEAFATRGSLKAHENTGLVNATGQKVFRWDGQTTATLDPYDVSMQSGIKSKTLPQILSILINYSFLVLSNDGDGSIRGMMGIVWADTSKADEDIPQKDIVISLWTTSTLPKKCGK